MFLNGGTIAQLRGLAWLSLTDIGMIGAGTVTNDGGGGGTTTWNYGSGMPCRVDPLLGDESVIASRLSDDSTHVITVPPGTTVAAANRFAITGRGTFEITAVRTRTLEPFTFFEAVQVS